MFATIAKVTFNRERLAFQEILYRIQEIRKRQDDIVNKLAEWPTCTLQRHGDFSDKNRKSLESELASCHRDIEFDEVALASHRSRFHTCKARLLVARSERVAQSGPVAIFT